MTGLPEPQPGYRWVIQTPPAPPRKRSPWPWIISAAIVVLLILAAWFAGEWLARNIVERSIRAQLTETVGIPADQDVDVTVTGAVLPQLITGTLDEVSISSQDVALGSLTGDISVQMTGVPVRGDRPAEGGSATITLDEQQLQALTATVDGFPADTVVLKEPNVTMSIDVSMFGLSFPIGVGLTPGAKDGDLVLSPAVLTLGGADVSVDELRSRFGAAADTVLREWPVCIAGYIPAGVTLEQVHVSGATLIAEFSINGGIVNDPALQANGTCQ